MSWLPWDIHAEMCQPPKDSTCLARDFCWRISQLEMHTQWLFARLLAEAHMQLCVGTRACTGAAFGTCCGGACLDMQAHMHTQSPVGSPLQRALACMRSATELSSASCKLQEQKEKLSPGPQTAVL